MNRIIAVNFTRLDPRGSSPPEGGLEVVEESQRELLRSRNTDIRAIPVDFADADCFGRFSASNKSIFDRLGALESSGLPLHDYVSVVCPEMSGNYLWSGTWGGVSGNVRKCPEIPKNPLSP